LIRRGEGKLHLAVINGGRQGLEAVVAVDVGIVSGLVHIPHPGGDHGLGVLAVDHHGVLVILAGGGLASHGVLGGVVHVGDVPNVAVIGDGGIHVGADVQGAVLQQVHAGDGGYEIGSLSGIPQTVVVRVGKVGVQIIDIVAVHAEL